MTNSPVSMRVALRDVVLDYGAIAGGVQRAESERLPEIGEMLMDDAQSLLRSRSRSSRPGESPTNWSRGRNSLRNMALDYSRTAGDVAMGPVKVDTDSNAETVGMTVPELMEFGGLVNRRIRRRDGRTKVIRNIRYESRSYTGAALKKATKRKRLRDVFFDSVGAR